MDDIPWFEIRKGLSRLSRPRTEILGVDLDYLNRQFPIISEIATPSERFHRRSELLRYKSPSLPLGSHTREATEIKIEHSGYPGLEQPEVIAVASNPKGHGVSVAVGHLHTIISHCGVGSHASTLSSSSVVCKRSAKSP